MGLILTVVFGFLFSMPFHNFIIGYTTAIIVIPALVFLGVRAGALKPPRW